MPPKLFLTIIHGITDLISMLFQHSDAIQQTDGNFGILKRDPEPFLKRPTISNTLHDEHNLRYAPKREGSSFSLHLQL